MRRHAALLLLGIGGLLLSPGAAGLPNVPGDPTPPVVVPEITGTLGSQGWYVTNVTVRWRISDPESEIIETEGCDIRTLTADTAGQTLSCRAATDVAETRVTSTFKIDKTAPTLVPDPDPDPNAAGWHRQPVAIRFPGIDTMSGLAGCSADHNHTSGNTTGTPINGFCTDRAGNRTDATYTLKYDTTAPTLVPDPVPDPNTAGWHRQALTIKFPGTDTVSGIASCTEDRNHSTGDTTGTPINGFCTDHAGNRTDATYTLKYDTTPPTLVPDPVPDPNAAGWHRQALTIKFPGTDGTSGIASCTADRNHTTGDTTGTPINGFCTDHAGNHTDATYTLKYDASPPELTPAPSREPDRNDWYNRELTVRFPGTDATSGIATCTADQRYSTPDSTAALVPGLCTDQAGNTTARAFGFKYDGTAPLVTGAVAQRPPEPSGWYVSPVTFDVVGSDALAGIDVCPDVDYDGPDGAAVFVSGRCVDKAGNVGEGLFPLKYDDTGPGVRAVATRDPDVNGWYNDPLTVRFVGSDDASGLASCVPPQEYGGPDTVFGVLTGTCHDYAGNVGLGSLAVMYDATAPQVDGASADRAPDGNAWYNRPLTVSFHGSDATSGIDACTVTRYIGPDSPSASLAGSCSDRAGNPSRPGAFPFKYDTTAPTIAAVKVQAGNRTAALSWEASPDTSLVEVVRSAGARRSGVMVYRGSGRSFRDTRLTNGVRYHYRLTGYDEARNSATREVAATPTAPLLSPQAGAVVSSPPRLVWKARRGATYYNVQVWRGRRIFSAWPTRRSLQLPREWTYRGRRYRLTPGRYRWYVWPGLGRRAQKEFGPLLGSSSFRVR